MDYLRDCEPRTARLRSQPFQCSVDDAPIDHGKGVLSVRYAMLFYVLKRLGLLGDATKLNARTQHIVTLNRKETETALQAAEVQL